MGDIIQFVRPNKDAYVDGSVTIRLNKADDTYDEHTVSEFMLFGNTAEGEDIKVIKTGVDNICETIDELLDHLTRLSSTLNYKDRVLVQNYLQQYQCKSKALGLETKEAW